MDNTANGVGGNPTAAGLMDGAPPKPADFNSATGFSHGAYASNQHRPAGYSQRHPRRNNMSINTAAQFHPSRPTPSEQTGPGTAFEMNFTPLLPSQLLLGSPFQPGTPHFPTFQPHQNAVPQHNQPVQVTSPGPGQQAGFGPHMFQDMNVGQQPMLQSPQSPTGSFGNLGNQGYVSNPQMQVASTVGQASSRTVYLGNIPPETSAEELLGHVRSGQIESVRMLPDKNCSFVSFLDSSSATHFHSDAILKKLAIHGQDIKIGWGKPSPVPTSVAVAVQQSGASRNVYLGNLPEQITEAELREDLGKFGAIDTVKLVREKAIGFVHFLSITNAIKAVSQLPQDPKWQAPRRVFYGKDRCAYVSKTQQQNAAQYLGIAPGYAHMLNSADRDLISNALAQQSVAAAAVATQAGGVNNLGNRTVYLGNIHPETNIEEICNVVRGGLLHHIRYIPDKHICFVTFIDPTSAASFFALSQVQGLMIHNRRLKIGWGKHSGALPSAIALAVSGGASRNVYIGNLDESWTEERLRQDFSEYGEIELVNALREKSCAFVNFTNIANAIKAIEAVRSKEEYARFKVNFGKDRCGNAPRQSNGNQGQGQGQGQTQQVHQHHAQSRDSMGSPAPGHGHGHVNGTYSSRGRSASPSARVTLSPPPGSTSSQQGQGQSQGHSPNAVLNAGPGGANPLSVYLNQVTLSDAPDTQATQPQQGDMAGEVYVNGVTLQQPHSAGHVSSMSQGINTLSYPSSIPNDNVTTVGGLLAPRNQAQQHARAVSLPAFSQDGQQQQQNGATEQQMGQMEHMLPPVPRQQQQHQHQQQSSMSGFGGLGGGAQWGVGMQIPMEMQMQGGWAGAGVESAAR